MIQEKLLFAVHKGSVSGRPAGIIMNDHCLPIACSHCSWDGNPNGAPYAELGFHSLWESTTNPEEFFDILGLRSIEGGPGEKNPNGLWVYEVTYAHATPDPEDDDESWEHLTGGELRRPTIEELNPLVHGQAPWSGVVL